MMRSFISVHWREDKGKGVIVSAAFAFGGLQVTQIRIIAARSSGNPSHVSRPYVYVPFNVTHA